MSRRSGSTIALTLFVAACLSVGSERVARAIGEQDGRIGGTITEAQTGAPVPGATIRAKSPALIGPARTTTSGDDGQYELSALPPGTYTVEFSYPSLKSVRRTIVVRLGELTPLDLSWSAEMTEVETTVVNEERHLTRPDSTQAGTVISSDQEARVATGRSYQTAITQVAGVRNNGTGNPNVKGGTLIHNRYLVDGLDVTDPVTNTFSANINFDSIGQIQVITGGFNAEYNSLGGVVNLITLAGSDKLHIDTSFYVRNAKLSPTDQYGGSIYDTTRPFDDTPGGPSQQYFANLNIGGPIIQHKLWFNLSYEFDYTERSLPSGPPLPNLQHPVRRFVGHLARFKLTWAPSERHRVTLSASGDPTNIDNTRQSNAVTPNAEHRQEQGGLFAILQWDYFHSQSFNTNVSLGFQFNHIYGFPEGQAGTIDFEKYKGLYSAMNDRYDYGTPGHTVRDAAGTTIWYNDVLLEQQDQRYTVQFDPSFTLRGNLLGSHELKAGIQSRAIWRTRHAEYAGGGFYTDQGGGFGEMGICDEKGNTAGCFEKTLRDPNTVTHKGFGAGVFVQDRWKPARRITLLPGIRVDYGTTQNSIGETVSHLVGVGPRLGGTIDLTGDERTIFGAYYGRSNETLTLLTASNADPVAVTSVYRWNDAMKAFDTTPNRTSGGADGYKIDDKTYTPPHTDEILLTLRREFFANSVVSLEYTWKRLSNIWDGIEINQVWDPSGYRVASYVDGKPHTVYLYTTPDGNYRTYQGIDFVVESRPTPHWDFYLAYTLSWLYGPGSEEFGQINGSSFSQYANPRQAKYNDGFLPEDVRHQLKMRASYDWRGLTVGGVLTFASGNPLIGKVFYNYNRDPAARRSPQGTEPGRANDPTSVTEFRTADVLTIDVRVAYDLYELTHQHITLIADFFNLLNNRPATDLFVTDDATFGAVANRANAFALQLGARFVY